ncbi:hypothetical protein KXD93_28705 [Mucilaginibacter sp. BJC16-A38]|uniref:contact-dependent growth inhibition system immunity protein n=1 Tax=Mucilaginibacter phenanthrenivorans TaxID=1234842 RepID=UPI0021580E61|nr:contact-dependent growth inhibition system immunity protein [Mucilaginibacter phenanthrenivorans]MCR8561670.1 hypothetical protein [Mucilaginibacter phenanthrenivorans]
MKFENNWRNKTLEALEKSNWGPDTFGSHLTSTIHQLRKKVLNDFTIEDLRIAIGQQMGLTYLIPIALEVLKDDLFAEGDFYEGDLLQAVLNIDGRFWNDNMAYRLEMCSLIGQYEEEIQERKIDATVFLTK